MKYEKKQDLPDVIQKAYPEEALEVYLDQYQVAWEEYVEKKGGEMGQKGYAHREAMAAVLREYKKDDAGNWYKRGEKPTKAEEQNIFEQVAETIKELFPEEMDQSVGVDTRGQES